MEHGYGEAESILQNLRDLSIVPLADGRVVALSGESVFFPMEETKTKKKKAQAQTGNALILAFSSSTVSIEKFVFEVCPTLRVDAEIFVLGI